MSAKTSTRKKLIIGLLFPLAAAFIFVRQQQSNNQPLPASEPQGSIHFSSSEYGKAWPLVGVDAGQVYCVENAVVFRADNGGQVYGLNGYAASYARAKGYDWKPIGDIQAVGKSIDIMLVPGRELCK
ncbi:hypothetical protein [Persicitalea jodogahamensis]|uniref:Uncharacterized protein n=1 Tax=Persicitalea jodogahamensis TaxID=402147 RepID=A0A8J3D395_9BACT|nr:hypothetical protein [Persicitalea jodogahamensis]GHB63889.1 hypothetical protein GCM10007390_17160 [Persicitalea jodogahamensis]